MWTRAGVVAAGAGLALAAPAVGQEPYYPLPTDTTAADCRARTARVSRIERRRLPVRIVCSEPARVAAQLVVGRARRPIGSGTVLVSGRRATLSVRLTRGAARRLPRLSARRLRRLRPVLRMTTADRLNNRRVQRVVLRLRP